MQTRHLHLPALTCLIAFTACPIAHAQYPTGGGFGQDPPSHVIRQPMTVPEVLSSIKKVAENPEARNKYATVTPPSIVIGKQLRSVNYSLGGVRANDSPSSDPIVSLTLAQIQINTFKNYFTSHSPKGLNWQAPIQNTQNIIDQAIKDLSARGAWGSPSKQESQMQPVVVVGGGFGFGGSFSGFDGGVGSGFPSSSDVSFPGNTELQARWRMWSKLYGNSICQLDSSVLQFAIDNNLTVLPELSSTNQGAPQFSSSIVP